MHRAISTRNVVLIGPFVWSVAFYLERIRKLVCTPV
jgi:hypothetical protein